MADKQNFITRVSLEVSANLVQMRKDAAKASAPDIGEERVSRVSVARDFKEGKPEFRRKYIEQHGQKDMLRLIGKK